MPSDLWNSLLDAEMNVRYWTAMCHRYSRYDTWSRIFLAITSSSTVAGWGFWSQIPVVWKSLSGLSAIIAIVLTVVDLPKKVSRMSVLAARWKQSQVDYELLWRQDRSLGSAQARSKYASCKHKEVVSTSEEHTLPYDFRLLKKCYDEVCEVHGLGGQRP